MVEQLAEIVVVVLGVEQAVPEPVEVADSVPDPVAESFPPVAEGEAPLVSEAVGLVVIVELALGVLSVREGVGVEVAL